MSQHQDYYYIKGLLDNVYEIVEEIYKKFQPPIIHHVLKKGGNKADGEGIFQEGLLAMLNLALKEDFVLTCPFLGLLLPICKNKWNDELRRRGKLPTGGFPEILEEIPDWDNTIEEKITLENRSNLLWECIGKLSKKNIEIFKLRLNDREKFDAIDDEMGYSKGVARVAFCRCKRRLKECIFNKINPSKQKEKQNF